MSLWHIEKLMMLFPAVLILELNSAILTDENLIQIVGECPKVNVIVLYNCKLLTETGLQIAVQRWDLEGMVLRRCGIYSDQLLRCICDHGSTFTSAGFVSPSTFTNSGIINLIRACPKLNNIALGWHPLFPVEFVDIIAPKLGNLEILVLAQGLCCDVVFNAVGKHCAHLEVLDIIDDKLGTCIACGAGLVFLLESCNCLKTLVIDARVKASLFDSPFVQNMLQSIRPNLKICCNEKQIYI